MRLCQWAPSRLSRPCCTFPRSKACVSSRPLPGIRALPAPPGSSAVTAAAVAHRIRTLEEHLEAPLFDRRHRSVRLNPRGQAYLKEVQRILAEVHGVSERQHHTPRRVRIVSVEAVAEKWLLPRLASFKTNHPGSAPPSAARC